ncbi:MAG: hypothetical protein A2Z88_06560 [Omnitrophica WOR_2 bacterium GWA2_47_8]|nr:MAG: hypothetical protein A2Z88_06560 [Omnitrophica WOR_2 bacterium GWA2_47_8]
MNNSGKVLTFFLVIIAIILVSVSGISVFFFLKEVELRKATEDNYERMKDQAIKLEVELKTAQNRMYVLEEKEKEADEKINGLMDEIELEQGLRDESKSEIETLKQSVEQEKQNYSALQAETDRLRNEKAELEKQVEIERGRYQELEARHQETLNKLEQFERSSPAPSENPPSSSSGSKTMSKNTGVTLAPIVVASPESPEGAGRILSVDPDNDFFIFNLGQEDGLSEGMTVSIYRVNKYLGDGKVTRVQQSMSAADFIPPISARVVQKNDRVMIKQ